MTYLKIKISVPTAAVEAAKFALEVVALLVMGYVFAALGYAIFGGN